MGKNGKGDEDGWNKQWELYTRTLAPRYKHASKGSSKMVVCLSMPSSTNRPWPPKGDGCRVSWGAKWPPLAWVNDGSVCDGQGSCQDVFFCWRNHALLVGDIYFCRFCFVFSFVFFFFGEVGEEGMCSMRSEMAHFGMWRLEPLQQLHVHMLLPGTMAAMAAGWVNAYNIVKGGKPSPSSSVDFSGWELSYARSVYKKTNAIQHIHAYINTYLSSYIQTKIVSALFSFETFATMWSKWRNINIEPCTQLPSSFMIQDGNP